MSSDKPSLPIKGGWLIALLTLTAALGQFASSAYLPSLPAIEAGMSTTAGAVQLTMTAYLAAFAVMQLVFGPLADRYGRRPVMISGMLLFMGGSLLCVVAGSIEVIILGRAVQAVGACAGVVASRAITRDLFDGPQLTKVMAAIAMAFSIVPAVAPVIGGLLQESVGWEGSFVASAILGLIVLVPVLLYLSETNQSRMDRINPSAIWAGYREVGGNPQFRAYALTTSAVMGALFAFLTGAPTALIGDGPGQVSPLEFGIYPALTIPGFMVAGMMVRKSVNKTGDAPLMKRGALIAAAGGLLMVGFSVAEFGGVGEILYPMIVFVVGMGFVFSVGHAGALRHFKERAGVASALMGVLQLGTAAVFSAIAAGLAHMGSLSFAIAMAVAGVAAVVFSRGCR